MSNETNLESIESNLQIKYLNNLISACSRYNINSDNIKKELHNLDGENNITINNNETQNVSITEKEVVKDNEKHVTETETIDYLYLKPWSKLTQIHKVIKIKEFVNNLGITNNIEKEKLKDGLIDQVKEKKSKNKVNYDETKGKILSISNLSFDNNKYILL